jgi:hypothetical protein
MCDEHRVANRALRIVSDDGAAARSRLRTRVHAGIATSARASTLVIHWLSPFCSAVRPSALAAILMVTQGRPRSMRETKPRFSSRASCSSGPDDVSMAGVTQSFRDPCH